MKLKDFLHENSISIAKFARKLGVVPHTIISIMQETREPRLGLAIKINKATRGKVKISDLEIQRNSKAESAEDQHE